VEMGVGGGRGGRGREGSLDRGGGSRSLGCGRGGLWCGVEQASVGEGGAVEGGGAGGRG